MQILSFSRDDHTKKFNKHYQFGLGSCHAATALRHDYVKFLKQAKKDFDIRYIRFHGVFNDDMHTLDTFNDVLELLPNGDKYVEENFYLVGVAYDNLLECGVKPFVELSFMPNRLAKVRENNRGFYGTNFNMPSDLDAWYCYIQSFIKFLINRYGIEEVSTWFFEVWNEPDLQGAFFKGTKQDYFDLYKTTACAIKDVNTRLKVGGPSTSGSKWVASFVDYCKKGNIPLDFVSTHQYPGDPFIGIDDSSGLEGEIEKTNVDKGEKVKKLMETFANKIPDDASPLDIIRMMFGDPTETKDIRDNIFRDNAQIVKSQAQGLPVYYTEWNLSATFSAYSNDTTKSSSYLVKTVLDVEQYLEGSVFWCISDIFEEMHQFKEEFHGGFGLKTIHGIPKPSYHAMKLMCELPEERYVLESTSNDGKVEFGAFKGESSTVVLAFRHSMKNTESECEPVRIEIGTDEKPKSVTLVRIDENHGNPLPLWEQKGSPKYLTRGDVDILVDTSSLITEKIEYKYENGIVSCNLNINENDVYQITINW